MSDQGAKAILARRIYLVGWGSGLHNYNAVDGWQNVLRHLETSYDRSGSTRVGDDLKNAAVLRAKKTMVSVSSTLHCPRQ